MIVDALRTFRQGIAGCEVAALADVSSRTVLAWDSALKWPQEQLDGLCGMAAQLLAPGARQAVLMRETGSHVFLRSTPDGMEVLCCLLAAGMPLDAVFDAADALCADLRRAEVAARA